MLPLFLLGSRLRGAVSSVRGLTVARWDSIRQALAPGRIRAYLRNTSWVWLGPWTFVQRTWLRVLVGLLIATVVVGACYWPVTVLQSWRIAEPGIGHENMAERQNPERRDRRDPDEVQRRRAELRSCIASSEKQRLHASREG